MEKYLVAIFGFLALVVAFSNIKPALERKATLWLIATLAHIVVVCVVLNNYYLKI